MAIIIITSPAIIIFNTITKTTSSYHPSHINGNIFITLQAQMQAFQGSTVVSRNKKHIF